MPTATTVRVVDSDREAEFPALLERLREALEARFTGQVVQVGTDAAPAPVPVIVHDNGDAATERGVREELDSLDPDWSTWIAVSR